MAFTRLDGLGFRFKIPILDVPSETWSHKIGLQKLQPFHRNFDQRTQFTATRANAILKKENDNPHGLDRLQLEQSQLSCWYKVVFGQTGYWLTEICTSWIGTGYDDGVQRRSLCAAVILASHSWRVRLSNEMMLSDKTSLYLRTAYSRLHAYTWAHWVGIQWTLTRYGSSGDRLQTALETVRRSVCRSAAPFSEKWHSVPNTEGAQLWLILLETIFALVYVAKPDTFVLISIVETPCDCGENNRGAGLQQVSSLLFRCPQNLGVLRQCVIITSSPACSL